MKGRAARPLGADADIGLYCTYIADAVRREFQIFTL